MHQEMGRTVEEDREIQEILAEDHPQVLAAARETEIRATCSGTAGL
jgi:hypothetical protein